MVRLKRLPTMMRGQIQTRVLCRVRWPICLAGFLIGSAAAMGTTPAHLPIASPKDLPAGVAAIIPIRDELTDVTVDGLKRRLNLARDRGATLLVFELDTPGGLVTSALAIADLIKGLTDVKTVAWVNTNAISGGAVIAVACDEIVMARSSRMGDSQVIMSTPEGGVQAVPLELQPKAYSVVVTEFRASASLRGYSPVLAEAFVIPEHEVWWLENRETGDREFVFREEKIRRVGESIFSDAVDTTRPWRPVETYFDILNNREEPLTQPVDRSDRLLQLSPSLAHAFGFSKGVVSNEAELKSRYNVIQTVRIEPSWSEVLALWLTSPYIRGFLMTVILLAAYVEFHTPGLGLAGVVALVGLALFVGAPYMTGLADVWEVLFIVGGLALIALELFVIPGFGIAGIGGAVLLLIGLLASFTPPEPGRSFPLYFPTMQETLTRLKEGFLVLVSSMILSAAGMVMLGRYLPRIPFLRQMVPANPTPSEVLIDDPYFGAARVGDRGETAGPLRPAGKARFSSMLVDVVTEGEFVGPGLPVEVVERRGNRVVVRAMEPGDGHV